MTMATDKGLLRANYRYFMTIQTRFLDNDELAHINNAVYYTYFEAIVVRFDMEELGLRWTDGAIPVVVESLCRFHRPLSFPEPVEAAMSITHLGTSSVKYAVGLFSEGVEAPAAEGHLVQVYTDSTTGRPIAIPAGFRRVYEGFG